MSVTQNPGKEPSQNVKQCCARLYETDVVRLLLGDSFHPGGLQLTERLGRLLELTPRSRILDVASGKGASAIFLAERFGCEVVGIDYGSRNVEHANGEASSKGLSPCVRFQEGDAESLPFVGGIFDAIVCECAFCTFPEKSLASREFARVLRNGGRVGLSDLTRKLELPKELDSLLPWVSCIADAQPIERYTGYLRSAGLSVETVEPHDEVLQEMVRHIQGKLLVAEIMVGLKKVELPGFDAAAATQMARAALSAIDRGQLGYAIITAEKPA